MAKTTDKRIEGLSATAKAELEHMRREIRDYPHDESTPTDRFDRIPQCEREILMDLYTELGGK